VTFLTALLPIGLLLTQALPQQDPQDPKDLAGRLAALEARVAASEAASAAALAERDAALSKLEQRLAKSWAERIGLRGYTQVRFTSLFGRDNTPDLFVPADRSVNEAETLFIRRGRFIFSGDVHERVFLYAQSDFNASVGGSGDTGVQMRDLYADIALDEEKEYRFRVGQSKVPYGWVNLNSAAEGERDVGVFFYWAPAKVRDLFRKLVRDGLKGSGDYGVLGIGTYSGQGPNRSDRNGETHLIARASYPYEYFGELLEFGVQGYTGRFVPTTNAIGGVTPSSDPDGLLDERAAVTAVLYPQPFGLEAEWTWGRSPELSSDFSSIGVGDLQGGYVQANYLIRAGQTSWLPFLRWNLYEGARKFARNAPFSEVNELDFGIEWSPFPALELTLVYTHAFERTNTNDAPYGSVEDVDRLGLQLQFNY
jgi:hypothetical protein